MTDPIRGRGRLIIDLPGDDLPIEHVVRYARGITAEPIPWELWGWRLIGHDEYGEIVERFDIMARSATI